MVVDINIINLVFNTIYGVIALLLALLIGHKAWNGYTSYRNFKEDYASTCSSLWELEQKVNDLKDSTVKKK